MTWTMRAPLTCRATRGTVDHSIVLFPSGRERQPKAPDAVLGIKATERKSQETEQERVEKGHI